MSPNKSRNNNNGATLGFEQKLWQAADPMSKSTEDWSRGVWTFCK